MNMRLWTHAPATTAASPTAGAGAAANAAAAVSDQFKTFVELKIQELTTARRELAAAVEEAKKMRATASAPAMPTTSSRCRSLSSTWETTDSDDVGDEEDDVEEYDEDADDLETQQREDAARRRLFLDVDFDDDMEHEESKDEFHDLAHGRDVASLSRAGSTNALPILRRLAVGASRSCSSDEDVTTATYPLALPAVRVSGRRRSNSRNSRSRRRRTRSESAASGVGNAPHNNSSSNSQIQASHTPRERRLRIISPIGSKIFFSGWVRGQPADVLWEVFDKSVQCVRIDVCNLGWDVPTTIAQNEANDGRYHWKKVVWGLPIKDGYYVNIYDATGPLEPGETGPLLATSERFAVIG